MKEKTAKSEWKRREKQSDKIKKRNKEPHTVKDRDSQQIIDRQSHHI